MSDQLAAPARPSEGASDGRRVPHSICRSWLLVNAARPDRYASAAGSAADAVVLDNEDAVDGSRKDEARSAIVSWLTTGGRAWVRVNDRASDFWQDDLEQLRGLPGLLGIVLPKVEDSTQVTETVAVLGEAVPVVALIESALGIEEAVAIARTEGVFRLAFGSGDYRRDTGASSEDLAMAYPRSRLVVASRIGGLPGPIDGPTVSRRTSEVREGTATAVAFGMTGKLCLDESQTGAINEVMSPSPSDIAWAAEVQSDFIRRGSVVEDGSDLPRLARAKKISDLADQFGLGAGW